MNRFTRTDWNVLVPIGFLAMIFILALVLMTCGHAHADPTETIDQPDLNGVICSQIELGQTPGEISEELHQGDLRVPAGQIAQRVWSALPECG